jgi:hypothetical protein
MQNSVIKNCQSNQKPILINHVLASFGSPVVGVPMKQNNIPSFFILGWILTESRATCENRWLRSAHALFKHPEPPGMPPKPEGVEQREAKESWSGKWAHRNGIGKKKINMLKKKKRGLVEVVGSAKERGAVVFGLPTQA